MRMEPVRPSPPPAGMGQPDAQEQLAAPWKILDPVWCKTPARMKFIDGEPAFVNVLRRSTRSFWSEAVHANYQLQNQHVKQCLRLEVSEASRLLAEGPAELSDELKMLLAKLSRELSNIDLAALASKGLRCLQRMVRGDDDPPEVLKTTLHSMRNILVLSCALELSEEQFAQMGCQGMPAALKERISSVLLREYSVDEIDDVMMCLGTAKYQVFNPGVHFNRRPRKVRPVATPSTIESSRISVSGLAAEK